MEYIQLDATEGLEARLPELAKSIAEFAKSVEPDAVVATILLPESKEIELLFPEGVTAENAAIALEQFLPAKDEAVAEAEPEKAEEESAKEEAKEEPAQEPEPEPAPKGKKSKEASEEK